MADGYARRRFLPWWLKPLGTALQITGAFALIWLIIAIHQDEPELACLNIAFIVINLIGILRWLS